MKSMLPEGVHFSQMKYFLRAGARRVLVRKKLLMQGGARDLF